MRMYIGGDAVATCNIALHALLRTLLRCHSAHVFLRFLLPPLPLLFCGGGQRTCGLMVNVWCVGE